MPKKTIIFLLLLFVSLSTKAESIKDILVIPEQLLHKELPENVVILDVRGEKEYLAGHIGGAVNLPVDATFNAAGRTDRVASLSRIQQLLGDAGIDRDTPVVIYDNGKFIDAGRMFWVMEVFGHEKVAVLDGGFGAWLAQGYPQTTVVPSVEQKTFFAEVRPKKIATKLAARLAIEDGNQVLLDARSEEEYRGEKSITARKGHIPKAINVPWEENFSTVDGVTQLKPEKELLSLYGGIDKDKKVITYCNKGKQSSFSYFVLRRLGYDAAHYDGSWFEWSQDINLPIEQ